ncbi:MAG: hypothetical protein RSD77_09850 [Romboutsia sp.]
MKRKLRGYEFEQQLKKALDEGTDKSPQMKRGGVNGYNKNKR